MGVFIRVVASLLGNGFHAAGFAQMLAQILSTPRKLLPLPGSGLMI
jgi:hypothetical protein